MTFSIPQIDVTLFIKNLGGVSGIHKYVYNGRTFIWHQVKGAKSLN